ncbi:hypothetical protein KY285_023529 [Solanum tuberosum]|nr:hypothetical protein KY289_023864 [Solanum tuberosum]KAH0675728.1 hypothetical protein KY285_023529 [Solanum tuberosum]
MSMAFEELVFDLDMALTMPEPDETCVVVNNSSSHRKETLMDVSITQIVGEMATIKAVDDVCTVCMQCFESSSSVGAKQVACGHVFHSHCLINWLSLHNSCPLCRFQVTLSSQQTPL